MSFLTRFFSCCSPLSGLRFCRFLRCFSMSSRSPAMRSCCLWGKKSGLNFQIPEMNIYHASAYRSHVFRLSIKILQSTGFSHFFIDFIGSIIFIFWQKSRKSQLYIPFHLQLQGAATKSLLWTGCQPKQLPLIHQNVLATGLKLILNETWRLTVGAQQRHNNRPSFRRSLTHLYRPTCILYHFNRFQLRY